MFFLCLSALSFSLPLPISFSLPLSLSLFKIFTGVSQKKIFLHKHIHNTCIYKKISSGKLQNPARLSYFSLYVTRYELISAPFNKITVFHAIQKRPDEGFSLTRCFTWLKVFCHFSWDGSSRRVDAYIRVCISTNHSKIPFTINKSLCFKACKLFLKLFLCKKRFM